MSQRSRAIIAALIITASAASVAAVSSGVGAQPTGTVTTYDYDNARSGDGSTTAITRLSANPSWTTQLDGAVYGEPLYFNDLVYVGTENNTLYALSPTSGRVAWHVHFGPAVRTAVIDRATGLGNYCGDIDPLGITGTPVIDPSTDTIFVADETMLGATKWQDIRHELYSVSLATHRVLWHRVIDPPDGNNPNDYIIPAQQQRPALTLANGRVYVGLGGLSGDCGKYHGWEVALPENGRGTLLHYQVPTFTEGAIWETNGAVVNAAGDLYVATGNGYSQTTFDGGDALIELSPTLTKIGWWAPSDWAQLTANDWDLGSAGPIAIPGSTDVFIAGKVSDLGEVGYIVNGTNPGHGPGAPVYSGAACPDGSPGDFGADASDVVTVDGVTKTFIYLACQGGMEALSVTLGAHPRFTQAWTPSTGSPEGPPVVAGGYVWQLDYDNNVLYAMNPVTGVVKWSRSTTGLNHFATPTVAGGHVFVPTGDGVQAFTTG